jgi:superoxide dismutase, Fe-Mn family
MTIHHTKHHNTYITNLNASLEKLDAAVSSGDVSGIIALQGALKFNGGGHLNHTLFWENLTPEKSAPSGALEAAIKASFGDFDKMKAELSSKSVAVQGSGWGWLGFNQSTGTHTNIACSCFTLLSPKRSPTQIISSCIAFFFVSLSRMN